MKHPQGDLLIDTGFGRHINEQFQTMSFMFRAITFYAFSETPLGKCCWRAALWSAAPWCRFPPATLLTPTEGRPGLEASFRQRKRSKLPHSKSGRLQHRQFLVDVQPLSAYTVWQPAADQLKAAGYGQEALRAILRTHAHWDHVSGLPDFPDVPVWVTPQERTFIRKGGSGQFGKPFTAIRYEEYGFEGGSLPRLSPQPRRLR